jgi:fructose-1-phosphate kinase PfkB-like protein
MKYWVWILILGLSACEMSDQQANAAPLTDEKLAHIMADLAVADAAVMTMSGSLRDSVAQVLYKQVFQKHQTDVTTYEQALRVITNNEGHMSKILQQAETLVKPEVAPTTPKPDSLTPSPNTPTPN